MDSLLEAQRLRLGDLNTTLFKVVDDEEYRNKFSLEELDDYRFLLAYLPLSDLAVMSGEDIIDNIHLARKAESLFNWGQDIPEELFRHFVLPHRISQEPFVNQWRKQFLNELQPLVKDLTMSNAALEVNHWCLSKATFQQTSGRDQDPLTTIRTGYGRCEEEMIFTIAAMRSIGIPARQCYTPYWAHADNNHAWVEVWTDGEWSYLGACEPAQNLSEAWFTRSAGRAMLVVSTAYGEYYGDEPVLKRYSRSTTINSTAVYGDVRKVSIELFNHKGKPQADQRVIFNLFNYGGFMPAIALNTDEFGRCELVSGYGSWIVSSGETNNIGIIDVSGNADLVELKLGSYRSESILKTIDYSPPKAPPPPNKAPHDSIFTACINRENDARESNLWNVWAVEAGLILEEGTSLKPNYEHLTTLNFIVSLDSTKQTDMMTNSRGNWGNIYRFLSGNFPDGNGLLAFQISPFYSENEIQNRFQFLGTLSKKDLRDFDLSILEDHYFSNSLSCKLSIDRLSEFRRRIFPNKDDDQLKDIYLEYVLKPRIDWEPSSAWRGSLTDFFTSHSRLIDSKMDKRLLRWLKKNIEIEEQRDRLGPGLTPDHVLMLGRGSIKDVERCYIGLCRVRGIPARFNEVTNNLERWNGNDWDVVVIKSKKNESTADHQGSLFIDSVIFDPADVINIDQMPDSPEDWHEPTESASEKEVLYYRDWVVQKWVKDHFSAMDFGYKKPFNEIEWPKKLSVGTYCLTTGIRQEDGSAKVKLTWFEVKKGRDTHQNLIFR